ncbi:membrane protein insertase YidC [Gemella sp. zg-570]|uniref:YidC/Oxa1 family membrane protein insertase n=1 Tax=Gemella sp. zg-570 TaxID=2840371 RepID=UPI00209A9B97|nr:membrane protein insertase YidC [Gemella sp. zg-570]
MKKIIAIVAGLVSMVTITGCSAQDRSGWFYDGFVEPMDKFLKFIYDIVGSWGLAIVIITLILRLVIMPFMLNNYKKQRESKIGMEKAKPELSVVQEKLEELKKEAVRAISKEDKIRIRTAQMDLQREQMAIMKKYNANPISVGGCLPILIQAPFLTGIYFTLLNPAHSAGIVDSTFLGVFSLGTRSYVLPVIAFIVYAYQTHLTMKLMPQTNVQPGQEAMAEQMKMIQWLTPVMISVISFTVAGAVGVYYIVGGLFMIVQTFIGYKLYPPYKAPKTKENFDSNKVTLVSNKKRKK